MAYEINSNQPRGWRFVAGEKGLAIKGFVAGEEIELEANVLSKILSSTIPFRVRFSSL